MKILLINNFHYHKGGSEAVYFHTAEMLEKQGHEVIYFSQKNELNEPSVWEEYFSENNDDLPKWKGAYRYFYNREAKRNLEKLIQREKPDIAHIHLFWGGLSPSIFSVLKKYKIPVIHTAHDHRMVCPAYLFRDKNGRICEACRGGKYYNCLLKKCAKGKWLESLIMTAEMYFRNCFYHPVKNLNGVIFVSEFERNKHIEHNRKFSLVKSCVLYNTISPHTFENTYRRKYFLFVGRLSQEKGILTLVKAFETLSDVNLKIVGTGPQETEIEKIITRNRLQNIEMLGFKSGDELKVIMSEASFIIAISECYETSSMTTIEAYSLGVPVIGARIGGIPEIVEDGKTGFLFQPGQVEKICDIVKKTLDLEEDRYRDLCIQARRFAEKYFDEDHYYRKLISFYEEVVEDYRMKNA